MGVRGLKHSFTDAACHKKSCEDYGMTGKGNIVGNGTYQTKNGVVPKFICRTSLKVSLQIQTQYCMTEAEVGAVFSALKMTLKGMSLRGTAEVLGVKLGTVHRWLRTAAEHSGEVNKVLMKDINVYRVKLDELRTYC